VEKGMDQQNISGETGKHARHISSTAKDISRQVSIHVYQNKIYLSRNQRKGLVVHEGAHVSQATENI
jgi:hypothetical protein